MHPKRDAEKVMKSDTKRVKNHAKMEPKIDDVSYFFEKGENAPDPLLSNEKRGSGHAKSDQKCIKNQCKIDAGESYAKMMQIMSKWNQNGSQNRDKILKIQEKGHAEIDAEI